MTNQSKSVRSPSDGFSIAIDNDTSTLLLVPTGTLATGTITLPAAPVDGQIVCFSSSQLIAELTVSPNSGQRIISAHTP